MMKEKSVNPAQAARKAEKAKQIKKGKAEALARRNEKLARRNPDRLQKELDDLKAIQSSGGSLTSHEQKMLTELERDIKAVKKAREALGDKAPTFSRHDRDRDSSRGGFGQGGRGGAGALGKRKWGQDESEESDVPEEVRDIPMPRDTPPPIPKEVLDRWYEKRREKARARHADGEGREQRDGRGSNANSMPLGENARKFGGGSASEEPKPEVKTVYEAKPVVRDLRKEATARFVPAVVKTKLEKAKGIGGLMEPEEADRLEKEGYMTRTDQAPEASESHQSKNVVMEEVEDEDN